MFQPKKGQSLTLQLRFSSIEIVIYTAGVLLLTQYSAGQYEVVSSPQQIFTITDSDAILPCRLEPPLDAVSMAVEWTRPDLYPRFVHVRRGGQDLLLDQNLKYEGRTKMSINKLRLGDVSLKLSKVELSDAGAYKCFIPGINKNTVVHLVVGAVSSPVIVSIDRSTSGLVLQCQSKGCYPEPEVLWLDSAGNLLSAGPTETLRGPDGLFTVSSKLTLTKTQSNSFTCRVQLKNINQTRETGIQIQDDVSMTWSDSVVCVIVVLSVALLLSPAVFFVLWKLKLKRGHYEMHRDKFTPKGRGEEEQLVKQQTHEKLEEKEEEKNDMQHVISILEEQKKELEITRKEHILKLKKVEEEWRENEEKLKKLSKKFRWDKDTTEGPLLKLKMELENKKREYKTYLESTEIKIQKSTDMITKIEDRKKKVENQIDEIKKQKNKTKLQKVKNVEQQTKPKEMKPLLETKIEVENEKRETKKPLDRIEKNIQKSIEAISLQQEQETEPERTGAEQKPKQKKEEKEKGENKKKLLNVKIRSHRKKHDETKTESKTELENEKTEHKSLFDSSEKNIQESVDMISILEEHETEPENSGAEQRPKQKKEEKEKGEKKMKLPKLKNPFHRSKHDETKPESKIELENKKTERENLLDLEKNVQEMTVLAGGIRQSIQSGLETQQQTD